MLDIANNRSNGAVGLAYGIRPNLSARGAIVVSGSDTHAGRAITTGISWPFELRR